MESPTRSAYRSICQHWPHLPVFAQDWFLDAVCARGEWNAVVVREGEEVVAVLPYFLKKRGPLRTITLPPFVKYLGPYIHPVHSGLTQEHRWIGALIDGLPPHLSFKQQFHPAQTNWLPFYWKGFRQTTRYTYRIDLSDLDALYAGLNRNIRRNLQKAKAQVNVSTEGSLEEFYRLNAASFQRQGLQIPYSFEQLQRHDEALAARGARTLFFARDEQERLHSAAYLIWDKQRSYYHLSGDDPALRDSGAGILLVWEAIQYTLEQLGLPVFDFEGSMLAPVEAIRRQFGARQEPYSLVWKYNRPWAAWLDELRGKSPR